MISRTHFMVDWRCQENSILMAPNEFLGLLVAFIEAFEKRDRLLLQSTENLIENWLANEGNRNMLCIITNLGEPDA